MESHESDSMVIRPAREGEDVVLTDVAMRSVQQRWNYPAEFMAWVPQHIAVGPEHLTEMITNVLEERGRIIGFYVLRGDGREMELSRLMVKPERIGTGCGRGLWEHAVETARNLGVQVITLHSDPNAEPFYLRMGAETVGVAEWSPPMMPGWRVKMMRFVVPSPCIPSLDSVMIAPGTQTTAPDWTVLLIGGASGTGKSTVARAIARRRDVDWLQVDDLRLALQWSNTRLPVDDATEALHFFERTPDVWHFPAEGLRDALIAVGQAMAEAVAIVVGNHVAQNDPVVIEGDGILPSIIEHPDLQAFLATGQLRVVFLAPADEDELLRSMIDRGRGVPDRSEVDLLRIAEMNWLYTAWLVREAEERSIPVVMTQPWQTVADRIIEGL